MSPSRRNGVRALVVLGSILTFLAIFSIWVERQVLETDDWVATSSELIENEEIRAAVAEYLVDELYENVDMEAELEEILPDAVSGLAGPAAGGLRQGAGEATERVLDTGTAQDLWETANRTAHEELVTVLEGGDETLSTDDGVVTLDLAELVRDLGEQIGVSTSLTNQIPDDAGQVEIIRSDELGTAQDIARAVRGLSILATVLALLSFGLAVALSRGQRWVAMLSSAIGLLAAAFAVLVVRSIAGGVVVDELVTDSSVVPAAEATWAISTELLTAIATSVIVLAILLGVAAWLMAPTPTALRTREFLAPGLRDHVAYFYGGLAIVVGLYFMTAPNHGLRTLITTLLVAILAALGIRELRRITAREFPDAPAWSLGSRMSDHFQSTRDSAAERKQARRDRVPTERRLPEASAGDGEERGAGEATGAASPTPSGGYDATRLDRLERLASLHERGVLTAEELAAEKASLLGEGSDLT